MTFHTYVYVLLTTIPITKITCLTPTLPHLPQLPTSIQQVFPLWDLHEQMNKWFPPVPTTKSHGLGQGRIPIPFLGRPNVWRPEPPPAVKHNNTLYDTPDPADVPPPGIHYPVWYAFKKIQPIQEKARNFARLARIRNIWPSIAASVASAWVIHPTIPQSIQHIRSPKFAIATVNILLVMAASMIINDLCDIPLDIINNPQRPLVTGKITIHEARWAIVVLLTFSEILVLRYLPTHTQIGNHLSILGVLLYTPYLKRIFVIKNIFCAALISYSLLFAGLANASIATLYDKNHRLFMTMFSVIFASSFQKEILLDISDYEGDLANGIPTFATKYGRYNAFLIAYVGLTVSIFLHSWSLLGAYGPIGVLFSYIMNPLLMALPMVYVDQYSRRSIRKYDRFSTKILTVCLLYFGVLSKCPAGGF